VAAKLRDLAASVIATWGSDSSLRRGLESARMGLTESVATEVWTEVG
jgi:hypothetical protein